ncbi:MAG: class I SAM-dependent methyltransferase, partial [Anaerolineales bacterium]
SCCVDYEQSAPTFDERYELNPLDGVAQALLGLVADLDAQSVLEIGCGTGHWLAQLTSGDCRVFGLDFSPAMLRQARRRNESCRLMRGRAGQLPLLSTSFDLVFCVAAIHQFERQGEFVHEGCRLLRPGGALAVVGMDVRSPLHDWYIHDYFETTLRDDLERYPTREDLTDWAAGAGFSRIEFRAVERILDRHVGREVLEAPFLRKRSCSQLAALTDEAYEEGLRRIEAAVAEADEVGEEIVFVTDLQLMMLVCRVGEED